MCYGRGVTEKPIIIAGAGIAGLAAALAARDREVLILEQAQAFEPVGAGIQLGPNAVAALQILGAWDAVAPFTNSPPEIHIRDGVSGQLLKRLKLGTNFERRFGAPYRTAHRADLHRVLCGMVADQGAVEIMLGAQVSGVTVHSHAAEAILANGTSFQGSALIGADGVRSHVRQTLFPGSAAIDSGEVFHRVLSGTVPALSGANMECVNLWLLPGGHVVHYPVGNPSRFNLIVVTKKHQTPLKAFPTACESLKLLLVLADGEQVWPGYFVKPLPEWKKGAVVLLGDSAHGTLPYLAQGAAMALEDCAALSRLLKRKEVLTEAFAQLSTARVARTHKLHHASLRAGKNYHMTGPTAGARNLVLRALPSSVMLQQLSWLYLGLS
jgi:salicylate hydroxylase